MESGSDFWPGKPVVCPTVRRRLAGEGGMVGPTDPKATVQARGKRGKARGIDVPAGGEIVP